MIIRRFLDDDEMGPQEQRLCELVFRRTLQRLNLVDCSDPVSEGVAREIVEIRRRGVTDAIAISEIAVRELGLPNCR